MTSKSLPNHYSNISADVDPRAPPSKTIRSDMGPYPGGMPGITPNYINNDKRINKTVGWRTNGSIRTTVQTRTRDQNFVNVNQLAFIDTRVDDRPQLYNLQQLNWWLVSEFPKLMQNNPQLLKEWTIKNRSGDIVNQVQAEKAFIMKTFKLYGAVVNRDVDNSDEMPIERNPRAFTCTVRGVCHLLDYWSTKGRTLHAYDSCYFVLKKVNITPDMKYQSRLTTTVHGAGQPVPGAWPYAGKLMWQIVPWSTMDRYIPVEVYSWQEEEVDPTGKKVMVEHQGGYWQLGNIHEYGDIGHKSMFRKRDDLSVSRDITYLHDNGKVTPIHFYLKLDNNCR